jgi:nucleoside-diphosphate-sugar epimerase
MAAPKAFLTGVTGFVGAHVARAFSENGWGVRALCRAAARPAGLPPTLEPFAGDLSARSDLEGGVRDCDAIVHVAGLVKARSLEEYREVNARGTQRLVRAGARSAPDALFLLVSSQAAAGPARDGRALTEKDPARPISWYGVSKWEAEEAVAREWPGPWIILRPGVLYGPGDRGLLTYFRLAATGWLPVPASDSRVQLGSVEDFALALLHASRRRDLAGRRGFLCDPRPVAILELAGHIAGLVEGRVRLLRVPDWVVSAAGLFETLHEKVTRRARPFNADKAREILAGDWLCDPRPLRSALELPEPEPLSAGLRRAWDWYRSAGWLPGGR